MRLLIESVVVSVINLCTLLLPTRSCGIKLIFKSSFDKANRTSAKSFRGPGIDEGLKVCSAINSLGTPNRRVQFATNVSHVLTSLSRSLRRFSQVLQAVKTTFDVPIVTDIHEPHQAEPVG